MKIDGEFRFDGSSPETVWAFLTDANRIAECLPGCETVVATGEGAYEISLKIGIGAIRGSFAGQIRLSDLLPVEHYQMSVSGKGAPGFMSGTGTVRFRRDPGATTVLYSGDVSVGGTIASVGQRMISGAARMVIDQFFKCASGKISGPPGGAS